MNSIFLENRARLHYADFGMSRAKHLIHLALPILLPVVPLLNGCLATFGEQQTQMEAALREDLRLVQEENQRLRGRVEGFDLQLEQLHRSVDALRSAPGGPTLSDVQALQQRIAALEGQLRNLDAARERDRQEIINILSAKIAQMVAPAAKPKSSVSTPARRAGAQEGYEHVVESGQTLSAIAAAYNVSAKSIIEANNLTNPNALRVGQKIFIPAP